MNVKMHEIAPMFINHKKKLQHINENFLFVTDVSQPPLILRTWKVIVQKYEKQQRFRLKLDKNFWRKSINLN